MFILWELFQKKPVAQSVRSEVEIVFGFKPTAVSTKDGVPVYSQAQIDAVDRVLCERASKFLEACIRETNLQGEELPAVPLHELGKQLTAHVLELEDAARWVRMTKYNFWSAHEKASEHGFPVKKKVGEYAGTQLQQQFVEAHPEKEEEEKWD